LEGAGWVDFGLLWVPLLKAQKGANKGKNHKIVAVADDNLPTPLFFKPTNLPLFFFFFFFFFSLGL
jgi:hypothetical protein